MTVGPAEVRQALERIRGRVRRTPVIEVAIDDHRLTLKLELLQHTGSFKARGALNKLLSLTAQERERGVLTASTGNHAQGFARALLEDAADQLDETGMDYAQRIVDNARALADGLARRAGRGAVRLGAGAAPDRADGDGGPRSGSRRGA